MNLLTNEQKITSSNGDSVVLTNIRIHKESEELGRSYSNSIFLEDISSLEVKYSSSIIFLILGALFLLTWVYQLMNNESQSALGIGTVVIAIIFLLLYWFSRKHIIAITPNGGKSIMLLIEKMKNEQVQDFVDKIQNAKVDRIKEIHGRH